jgi:hypothetical protein
MWLYPCIQWLLFAPSELGSKIACHSGGRRRTESDGKVEDEATPEHTGDGLDGHLDGICWCDLFGCKLGTGITLVDGKLAVG